MIGENGHRILCGIRPEDHMISLPVFRFPLWRDKMGYLDAVILITSAVCGDLKAKGQTL
jgi:hypothetical protein